MSLFDTIFDSMNLGFVRILRLLRALRPLRFISHNMSLRLVVTALLESVSGILTVVVILFLIWIMFGILGVSLLKNKMKYCYFDVASPFQEKYSIFQIKEEECIQLEGGHWISYFINFDNIFQALNTLFVLSSFEGWPTYIWRFVDATEDGPVQNSNLWVFIYFFIFLMLGSVFFVKLFIGVIFLNYIIAQKNAINRYITEQQSKWIQVLRPILKSRPYSSHIKIPENEIQLFFYNLTNHKYFEFSILIAIAANIIVLALHRDQLTETETEIYNQMNLAFTIIFAIEAGFKMIGHGLYSYFHDGWNKYDFLVVLISLAELFIGENYFQFKIAKVFRILRLLRLIRLIKSFKGLQQLIMTTFYSLPALFNVAGLLLLIFFIYSVLAVFLFKDITLGSIINSSHNFHNFLNSFLLLFRCSTGEDWYKVMWDTSKDSQICVQGVDCSMASWISLIFFISFVIIVQYIMLNLFILILVQELEINYLNINNPLHDFQQYETIFRENWAQYSDHQNSLQMKEKFLLDFILYMEKPLGMGIQIYTIILNSGFVEENNQLVEQLQEEIEYLEEDIDIIIDKYRLSKRKEAAKTLMLMNIYIDNDGFAYYNDLFFQLFKLMVKEDLMIDAKPQGVEIVRKAERGALQKLKAIRDQGKNSKDADQADGKKKAYNPILKILFVTMCFKSWRKFGQIQGSKMQARLNKKMEQIYLQNHGYISSEQTYSSRHDDSGHICSKISSVDEESEEEEEDNTSSCCSADSYDSKASKLSKSKISSVNSDSVISQQNKQKPYRNDSNIAKNEFQSPHSKDGKFTIKLK